MKPDHVHLLAGRWGIAAILLGALLSGCAANPRSPAPEYPDRNSTVKPAVAVVGTVTSIDESRGRLLGVQLLVDHVVTGSVAPLLEFGSRLRFTRVNDLCPGGGLSVTEGPVNVIFHLGDTVLAILAPPDRTDTAAAGSGEQDLYSLLYVRWVREPMDDKGQAVYRQTGFGPSTLECEEGEVVSTRQLYDSVERTWDPETMNLGDLETDIRDFYTHRRRWRLAGKAWLRPGRLEEP